MNDVILEFLINLNFWKVLLNFSRFWGKNFVFIREFSKILGQFRTWRSSPVAEAKTRTSGSLNQFNFLALIDIGFGQVQTIFQNPPESPQNVKFWCFSSPDGATEFKFGFGLWWMALTMHWNQPDTNKTLSRPIPVQFHSTNQPGFSTLPKKLKNLLSWRFLI